MSVVCAVRWRLLAVVEVFVEWVAFTSASGRRLFTLHSHLSQSTCMAGNLALPHQASAPSCLADFTFTDDSLGEIYHSTKRNADDDMHNIRDAQAHTIPGF